MLEGEEEGPSTEGVSGWGEVKSEPGPENVLRKALGGIEKEVKPK